MSPSLKKEWISEKKLYKKRKSRMIHDPQKRVAKEIIQSFSRNDLVTLCAPPQWGKTGVSLFVSYIMAKKKRYQSEKYFLHNGDVRSFLVTADERKSSSNVEE